MENLESDNEMDVEVNKKLSKKEKFQKFYDMLWLANKDYNKYLSCLSALTLLGIVEKHSIDIDYHE